MKIGNKSLDLRRPVVMGILNVTPDSFWEGSRKFSDEAISERVREVRDKGAAIIDIGGYSTRPGAPEVTPEEELERVTKGVEAAKREAGELIISIDTFRASVAEGILRQFGSCIINDISGGELDPAIIDIVAKYKVPYVAMHMRGTPSDMQQRTEYKNITDEVRSFLLEKAIYLEKRGINDIILDPGFGFAKTTEQNYELLDGMDTITAGKYPVLAGISRKSMIYKVLETTPAETLAGTAALNWECLRKGAKILRVHDVKEAMDVARLFEYYSNVRQQDKKQ